MGIRIIYMTSIKKNIRQWWIFNGIFPGDVMLQTREMYMSTPLHLYALTERLKLPEPTCGENTNMLFSGLTFMINVHLIGPVLGTVG